MRLTRWGRLRRRNQDRAARRIEALHGYFRDALAGHERDAHGPALNRSAARCEEDLKFLRPVMRRAVVLGSGKKTRVVGEIETLHERRYKLIRWKTTERAIFRWDMISSYEESFGQINLQPVETDDGNHR